MKRYQNTKLAEEGSQHHPMSQYFYYVLNDFLVPSLHRRHKTNWKEVAEVYCSLIAQEEGP